MFGKVTAVISVLALALICAVGATAAGTGAGPAAGVLASIGTAFTYQGQLQSGGAPVNEDCDFMFSLWDAAGSGSPPAGGNQVGSTQPAPNTPVINGLFAVRLDFGSSAFRGQARWLQTAVRCPAGSGDYTTLAPRQALTPVPYALFSQDLALPFDNWTESPLNAFKVRNAGAGPAGLFEIDNPANDSAALKAHSNGAGAALGAWGWNDADAFWATTYGTGNVANFGTDNPDNPGTVVNARTKGTGSAASFRIENTLNSQSALYASTTGSGNAGSFYSSGSGNTFDAGTQGTGGVARLHIDNPDNTAPVVDASTVGKGHVGRFTINNPLSSSSALYASTNGSGDAGHFDSTGSRNAVGAWGSGSGTTLFAGTTGTGDDVFLRIDNPNNTGSLISAETNGLGKGASFRINNTQNTEPALDAYTNGSGPAGMFRADGSGRGVTISVPQGNQGLNVVSGSKNAVVGSSEGARLLYSEESSAVWFSDYGFGRLADGSAFIAIDPIFAETVNLEEPYHVFVQSYGDAELYVSRRTPAGFEVRLRAGDPGVEFSYRLVAVRRGYEDARLERAPWADDDPNLYPAGPAARGEGGPQ
jgi:hypothetical protein